VAVKSGEILIGYELQKMIDTLVDANIPSPVVCGVWVDGKTCSTYKMDLKYNGLYRLIELDAFQLPTTMEDIMKARKIFSMLMKLK
jgi:Na+/glutamate symporter